MKRRDRLHIIAIVVLLLVYVLAEYMAPAPIDWSPTFDPDDTRPYGTTIVADLLTDAFPEAPVTIDNGLLHRLIRDEVSFPHPFNLIIVNGMLASDFEIDRFDSDLLMEFVSEGGSVLLAGNRFAGPLADTLRIEVGRRFDYEDTVIDTDSSDTTEPSGAEPEERTSVVEFSNPAFDGLQFTVERNLASAYFYSVDTVRTTILSSLKSETSQGLPNFIRIDHGDGAFYVSAMPYTFTNYAMTDSAAAALTFATLSHLPVQRTVWNTSYTPGGGHNSRTYLRYVLSNSALRWAWYITLFGGVVFILFRSRRRQRVIPVVEPNTNATLGFVDAIGRLYYQRGNHADLAQKKITHFHEYLRTRLGINPGSFDDAVVERVAARSGVSTDRVRRVVATMNAATRSSKLTGKELLKLSREIDDFYRLSRR